jgi:hypothetical protein
MLIPASLVFGGLSAQVCAYTLVKCREGLSEHSRQMIRLVNRQALAMAAICDETHHLQAPTRYRERTKSTIYRYSLSRLSSSSDESTGRRPRKALYTNNEGFLAARSLSHSHPEYTCGNHSVALHFRQHFYFVQSQPRSQLLSQLSISCHHSYQRHYVLLSGYTVDQPVLYFRRISTDLYDIMDIQCMGYTTLKDFELVALT